MLSTLPNILTLTRIFLIPVFVVVFYLPVKWSNEATTLVFTLAAITDWVDGYLARKWQQTTAFGAFLDPVADKLMVAVVLVLMVQHEPTPWFAVPAAVIIGREIAVSALREWMAAIGERAQVAVSVVGKFKTTAQMIALVLLLYRDDVGLFPTQIVGYVMFYTAAALTLWSMILYLQAAWPLLLRARHEK
jgi:CDP-diacylglycerol--glycerol-3-phosphate 3-phosphatidyltransferase/cardiolipin synthase